MVNANVDGNEHGLAEICDVAIVQYLLMALAQQCQRRRTQATQGQPIKRQSTT